MRVSTFLRTGLIRKILFLAVILMLSTYWRTYDKVNWNELSINPAAIHILEKTLGKVNWNWLSYNENNLNLIKIL
jgi:hypothetical protein